MTMKGTGTDTSVQFSLIMINSQLAIVRVEL